MISPNRIALPDSFGVSPDSEARALVDELLAAQQSLTAVERFSARHDGGTDTDSGLENKSFYRDLIPLREPAPGEQYAFEVDLDRCTGCKACVTACHSLNGLDEDETWRSVGVLQRVPSIAAKLETASLAVTLKPVQQHVTTACHHCADPGCAQGCPTLAYEKDPVTGVVRHLDDQCFGCQYCILKCPYDVPQYSAKRGIVRKCDLCIGRLRAGEAPACAQACPTQAIRVTLVETAVVRAAPAAVFDLPGVPDPSRVMPTTRYVSTRGIPLNLTAADSSQVRPEHAHAPLVLMLVASQAAAGYWALLTLAYLIHALSGNAFDPQITFGSTTGVIVFPWRELLGVLGVQGALGLSLFHLGRPWLAWKAFLGWKRSWLSREVIAFTALATTTGLYAVVALAEWFVQGEGRFAMPPLLHQGLRVGLAGAVLLSAWAAVYASAMVYRDTPRLLWATRATLWRFGLTALICAIPAWLLALRVTGDGTGMPHPDGFSGSVLLLLPIAQLLKLLLESSVLRHHQDDDPNALWKAAQLLWGPFRRLRAVRIALGLIGGIALPCALLAGMTPDNRTLGLGGIALAAVFLLVTAGELIERFFFFTTAIAPRMPGGRV